MGNWLNAIHVINFILQSKSNNSTFKHSGYKTASSGYDHQNQSPRWINIFQMIFRSPDATSDLSLLDS